jgi:hypothetical protein
MPGPPIRVPFKPAEFEGLQVTPYVDTGGCQGKGRARPAAAREGNAMSRTPAAELARLKVQHPGWISGGAEGGLSGFLAGMRSHCWVRIPGHRGSCSAPVTPERLRPR